jgi:hypothetical protein
MSAKVQYFQQTAKKRIDESFFISPECAHKAVIAETRRDSEVNPKVWTD